MSMDYIPVDVGVVKTGYLTKGKTMKKKFFVLREATVESVARLEYYDSEKKFNSSAVPKRVIQLKSCFSINAKSDKKTKYAIVLYTKDDCFSIVCDTKKEHSDWLASMQELQVEDDDSEEPRPYFEHIWPVTVKPKGLGNGKVITPTAYRLCLTDQTLSLIRPHEDKSHIVFQFSSIRRCGHSDCFFLMELGRSSVTGAGELWMQVEDTVIAQNMHEAILNQMKTSNSSLEAVQSYRPRSRSSASDKKSSRPINMPTHGYDSSTLPVTRSQTMSAADRSHSPLIRRQSQQSRSHHSVMSYSPAASSSVSSHSSTVAPDTVGREETSQYFVMSPQASKDDGSEGGGTNYMNMDPSTPTAQHPTTLGGSTAVGLPASSGDPYMDMSPGPSTGSTLANSNYFEMSTSISSTSSNHDTDDLNYLDMNPVSHALATVQERLTNDDGYLNMSPGNSPQLMGSGTNLRPDKAYSYLSEAVGSDEFPKRAYSVGSKPMALRARPLKQSYMEMQHSGSGSGASSRSSLEKVAQKCSSAPHLPDDDPSHDPRYRRTTHEARPGTTWGGRKDELPELFMEFDFVRQQHDGYVGAGGDFRPRTSSGGARDIHPRTSSFGHEMPLRQRLGSASTSKAAMSRTSSVGNKQDYTRHRTTSTVGPEMLHPRTSSFGQTDAMRPRSSSYGNPRQQRGGSSRDSSQESLRKLGGKKPSQTSQESVNSGASIDYLEMSASLSRSPSRALEATFKSESAGKYLEKALRFSSDEYMAMEATQLEAPHIRSIVHHQSLERPAKHRSKGRRTPTSMMKSSGSSSDSLSSQSRGSSSSDTPGKSTTLSSGRGSDGEYVDINYSRTIANRMSPDGSAPGSRPSNLGVGQSDSYVAYAPGVTMRESSSQRSPMLEKVASVVHDDIPRSNGAGGGAPVKHVYVNVDFPPSPAWAGSAAASSVHSKTPPEIPAGPSVHSKSPPEIPGTSRLPSKSPPEIPCASRVPSKSLPEIPTVSNEHSMSPPEIRSASRVPSKSPPEIPNTSTVHTKSPSEIFGVLHMPSKTPPEIPNVPRKPLKSPPEIPSMLHIPSKSLPEIPNVPHMPSKLPPAIPSVSKVPSKTPPEIPAESSVDSTLRPGTNVESRVPTKSVPVSGPHRRTPPTKPIPLPPNIKKGTSEKKPNNTSTSPDPLALSTSRDSNTGSGNVMPTSSSYSTPEPFSLGSSPVKSYTTSSSLPPFDVGAPLVTSPVTPAPFGFASPTHSTNAKAVAILGNKSVVVSTSMPPPFDFGMPTMPALAPVFDLELSSPTSPRGQVTTTPIAATTSNARSLTKSESGSDITHPTRHAKLTSRGSTGSLTSMSAMPVVGADRHAVVSNSTSTQDLGSSRRCQQAWPVVGVSGASSEHNLLGSRHSSKGSISGADSQEPELNYAKLDLGSLDNGGGDRPSTWKDFYVPTEDRDEALSYAQIDFVKSGELKVAQKEKRLSFEL